MRMLASSRVAKIANKHASLLIAPLVKEGERPSPPYPIETPSCLLLRRGPMSGEPAVQREVATAQETGDVVSAARKYAVERFHPALLTVLEQRDDMDAFRADLARIFEVLGDSMGGLP